MSTRPPAPIINSMQADLLDALRDAPGPMTFAQLQAAVGMGKAGCTRPMNDLRERELVEVVRKASGRLPMLYGISRSGSRALARYRRKQDLAERDVVPAPTYSTAGTTYVPAAGFCRNDGNKHLPSRGFAC